MSTFLQLCQKTARNCMIPGTGPTDTTTQTGELLDIVNWVADAYVDIQNWSHVWRWQRHGFTVNTVASTKVYAGTSCTDQTTSSTVTNFSHWLVNDYRNPPKIYLTSSGQAAETPLIWVEWDDFNYLYGIGNNATQEGQPVHITVNPRNEIQLGPVPDAVYTVTGEYYRSPEVMSADADVPDMPSQYHDLIVYIAMQKYGMSENAPEIVARGDQEAKRLRRALERNQIARMRLAGPMV